MTRKHEARPFAGRMLHPSEPTRSASDARSSPPPGLVRVALWLGAMAWLLELAILTFRKFALGHVRMWNQEAVWMGPIAYTVLFGLGGVVLHAVVGRSERGRTVALFLLATVAATAVPLVLAAVHPIACLVLGVGVGARVTKWARDRGSFDRVVGRTFRPATIAIVLSAAVAAGQPLVRERLMRARLPAATAGAPNILFVILDTVRSWNLSLHGYERPTTPELARFAARGVTFDLALSTAPYTLPSHFSIFTGLYPGAMGPIMEFDYGGAIPATQPMLAEVLAGHGYATAGFVANLFYTSSEFGLTRGFSRYEDFPVTLGQFLLSTALGRRLTNNGRVRRLFHFHDIVNRKTAGRIVDDFLDWESGIEDRPFFAFLNIYDAHEPYLPPSPFEERFVREPPRDGFFYDTDRVQRINMENVSEEETRAQMDRYDGAIAALDAQLGRLFDTLETRGLLENTIVVVTSDHGEEFMEHGRMGHLRYVYMSLLHVPLVVVAPSRAPAGRRVPAPVSIADIPATALDLARLPHPPELPGRSLGRFWSADAPGAFEPILAEANPGNNRKSLLVDGLHYIRNVDEPAQLFDYTADRLEQRDLAASRTWQAEMRRLDALLDSLLESSPQSRGAR